MAAFDFTNFNPTDLEYQAKKEFPPDKESLWNFPPDNDGWMHAHNMIRAELKLFEECLEAVIDRTPKNNSADNGTSKILQMWEIKAFQTVFDAHFDFVWEHHTNEDEILTPKFKERIVYPPKLTDDHEEIVRALKNLKERVHSLKEGDDIKASLDPLLKEWTAYGSNMKEHLKEEEVIGLPLMRAYFQPDEYKKLTEEIIKRDSYLSLGGLIYHMGADRFRNEFMKQEGIPFFVWHVYFRGAYIKYPNDIISFTEALKEGDESRIPSKFRFFLSLLGL